MNTKSLFPFLSLAVVALFAGCASEPGTSTPQDSTKYTLENTENFELLGKGAQNSVACTGLQPRTLPDGRLEVVASVKNREDKKIKIQASCVFKDSQGFALANEAPPQAIVLAPNATEALRFTAQNASAKKYTIRVRETR